jgi:ADP-ribosylglycohydrolase
MRSAPFGLCFDRETAYQLAAECAAQTHGHPTAIRSTGLFVGIVADLTAGVPLREAVDRAVDAKGSGVGARETRDALAKAVKLADAATGGPTPEDVAAVGAGWIAEEALGVAAYCALACGGDVVAGLLAAVNHGGDSDSTGAIAGNLLGAAYGVQALPAEWVAELEALTVVNRVADDLIETFAR